MKLLSKLIAWMLNYIPRRQRPGQPEEKRTVTVAVRPGMGKTEWQPASPAEKEKRSAPRHNPTAMHRAGGKVDPAMFKDAPRPARVLPASDPRSPAHQYWLQDDDSNPVTGFGVGNVPGFMGGVLAGAAAQEIIEQVRGDDYSPAPEVEQPTYESVPDTAGVCDSARDSYADTGSYDYDSGFSCDNPSSGFPD